MSILRSAACALCASSLALASAGCSLALALDDAQCKTDADCQDRGGEFADSVCVDKVCTPPKVVEDPKWGCIGKVDPVEPGHMDTLTIRFVDLISNDPVTDVSVKLCNKYDPPCNAPIGTPTPAPNGDITATIPSDLEAYVELTHPDYYPTIAFLDHVAQKENSVVFAIPTGIVSSLAQNAGVTLDETDGIVLVRLTDCTLNPTAGASVSIFPTGTETRFYNVNNTVEPDATKTDTAGNAGFVNVKPGNVTLTGTVGPGGMEYGTVQTLVRAATITTQILRPTPTL